MNGSKIVDLWLGFWHCMLKLFSIDYEIALRSESARITQQRLKTITHKRDHYGDLQLLQEKIASQSEADDDNCLALLPEFEGNLSECRAVLQAVGRQDRLSNVSQYRLAAYVATLPPAERLCLEEHPFDAVKCA